MLALAAVAALIFLVIVSASYRRSPDLGGLLTGIFTGLLTGLIVALVGMWVLVWLASPKTQHVIDTTKAGELEELLAATLADLEATRADVIRVIRARLVTRVPLGLAAGVGCWMLAHFGKKPPGLFDLLLFAGMGGLLGYAWASFKLSDKYRRLYKSRVLPQLAAQFGALTYRPAVIPDMGVMRNQRVFRDFDGVTAEDEIFGTYRGLPISIAEVKLTCGSGKDRQTVFDGLLTTVELPRRLAGTTAIIADNGMLGNLHDRIESKERERVQLEDPRSEKAYEVYATDQIGARALLTPAFMERLLTLGERAGFMRPLALAQDNRLTIALPKKEGANLFEPPSYRAPAKIQGALLKLHGDIAAVLRAADAVIDLDQASRAVGVGNGTA